MNQFQSIGEVLAAVRRRAWVILTITMIGCILSVWYALNTTKSYQATAVVQIEDAQVSSTVAGALAAQNATSRRLQLIEQRLMSRDNLIRIMDKHVLFNEEPERSMSQRVHLMREAASIQEIVDPRPVFTPGGNAPSGLRITVQLADPEKAAEVANELMASVIEQSETRSLEQARATLAFFQTQEAQVENQIQVLEDEISAFKLANAAQLPAGLADLRAQLSALRSADLALDREIVSIEANAGRKRAEDVARQIGQLEEQKALIAERSAQIEAQIAGAPEAERELGRLEREMDKLNDQYSVITRQKAEAQMGQALQDRQGGESFEVLETALVPDIPVSASRKKLAMAGGVLSVFVGLVAAFVLELMNPAIRSAQQMERILGLQPVVSIPVVSTRQDRRWGGLRFVGKVLGLVALAGVLTWALSRFGDVLPRRGVDV